MKYLLTIIVLLVGFTGGAQEDETRIIENHLRYNSIECKVCTDTYVDDFYADMNSHKLNTGTPRDRIVVRFSDFNTIPDEAAREFAGLAAGYRDDSRVEIYLDLDAWAQATRVEKYQLIYHELAHDLLDSDHVEDSTHLMSHDSSHRYKTIEELNKAISVHFAEVYESWTSPKYRAKTKE